MKALLITLITFAMRFVVPFIMPLMLLFAVKVDDDVNPYKQPSIQRYRLPKCFAWFDTPDQTLPGGLYEHTVKDVYDKWGWFICSWYWLAIRNVMFGFAWQFGKIAGNYYAVMTEREREFWGVSQRIYRGLGLQLILGGAVYRDWYYTKTKQGFWAVPRISLRRDDA